MRLKQPFLKLPIRFDAVALAAEVRALPPSAWTPHPTGFIGNEAVRLVTPVGEDSDAIDGPMGPKLAAFGAAAASWGSPLEAKSRPTSTFIIIGALTGASIFQ